MLVIQWGSKENKCMNSKCGTCKYSLKSQEEVWKHEQFIWKIILLWQFYRFQQLSWSHSNSFEWWDMHEHKMLTGAPQVSSGSRVVEWKSCLMQKMWKRILVNKYTKEPHRKWLWGENIVRKENSQFEKMSYVWK